MSRKLAAVALVVACLSACALGQDARAISDALVTMPMFGIIGEMAMSTNKSEAVNVTALDISLNPDCRTWRDYDSLGVKYVHQLAVVDGVIRSASENNVCSNTNSDAQQRARLNLMYTAIGANNKLDTSSITHSGSAMVRGKYCWVLMCTACLPSGTVSGGYTLQWYFEATDGPADLASLGSMRAFKATFDTLDTMGVLFLQVDIAWLSTAVPVEELQVYVECLTASTSSQTVAVQSRPVMVPQSTAFPDLPSTFRAFVEVTFLNQSSFVVEEEFHPVRQFARSKQRGLYKDVAGRRVDMWNEVDGSTSLVYHSVTRTVAYGATTSLSTKMIDYFFDPSFKCSKNLFGSSVTADSVSSLLLKDTSYAIYMGPVSNLRGYPLAYFWQSDVNYGGGFVVEWYFDSPTISATLLRMVIKGTGVVPFFAHRPFYQLNAAIPDDYASAACRSLAGPEGCHENLEDTAITYDFYGVGPLSTSFSAAASSECLKTSSYNSFPPPDSCESSSSAGNSFAFFLVSALIGAIVGGAIVYWRVRTQFFAFLAYEEKRRSAAAAVETVPVTDEAAPAAVTTPPPQTTE